MGDDLAALRHAAGQGRDQAADRVDFFVQFARRQVLAERSFQLFQRRAGVDLVDAAGARRVKRVRFAPVAAPSGEEV